MNTATLIYEAMELARSERSDEVSIKLQEILESFQEFEKRYNCDRLGDEDFEALKEIAAVTFEKIS